MTMCLWRFGTKSWQQACILPKRLIDSIFIPCIFGNQAACFLSWLPITRDLSSTSSWKNWGRTCCYPRNMNRCGSGLKNPCLPCGKTQKTMHTKEQIVFSGPEISKDRKILFLLHGRGGTASDIISLADHLAVKDFSLVAPQATGNTWYQIGRAPVATTVPTE